MLYVTLAMVLCFIIATVVIIIWRRGTAKNKCAELLNRSEMLIKEQNISKAREILNHPQLSSRYDELGQKANFLSAVCLEKLGRNLEASYEYATYLAKFPRGIYSDKAESVFKQLWEKFGPFDYRKFQEEDSCGFTLTEEMIKKLTS